MDFRSVPQCWMARGVVLALVMTLNSAVFAQVNVPTDAQFNLPAGSMNLACAGLNASGTYNIGASQVLNTGNVSIQPGGTVNGGSGTLQVTGHWGNSGNFIPGTSTVIFAGSCSGGTQTIDGPNTTTFYNLTLQAELICGQQLQYVIVTNVLTLLGGPIPPCITVAPGGTVIGGTATAQAIPTLSEWAMILLSLLMAGNVLWRGRAGTLTASSKNSRKNKAH